MLYEVITDDDWPTWEMHPAGDEFVILVSGDVDLVMARGPGHDTSRMAEPGTFDSAIWANASIGL